MVKRVILAFTCIILGLTQLAGCHQQTPVALDQIREAHHEVPISIEERRENLYEVIKVIEDAEELRVMLSIIETAKWEENTKVEMAYPPKYRFRYNHENYLIWVTPQRNRLEIVIQGQDKYLKLPHSESQQMYLLFTDEEL